jgi:membrane-bound metal-dependent hydrolase YbcI (DUF457 family)
MDFVSHALWGGSAFGRRTMKAFVAAAGISLLPDVLTEGLFGVLYVVGIGGMPGWDHGHPNITAYPLWSRNLYSLTHSLAVFALVFALIWTILKRPVWVVGAWGLHILIDIPTHSVELFPTPFLWPFSDFRFDGVEWYNPIVFGTNVLLLVGTYLLWLRPGKRSGGSPGTRDVNEVRGAARS